MRDAIHDVERRNTKIMKIYLLRACSIDQPICTEFGSTDVYSLHDVWPNEFCNIPISACVTSKRASVFGLKMDTSYKYTEIERIMYGVANRKYTFGATNPAFVHH